MDYDRPLEGMMNLICTKCGQVLTDMPWLAQFAHVVGYSDSTGPTHDAVGHHIAIQAKREWCPGPWEAFVSYKQLGGIPYGGGTVAGVAFKLEDGRVLIRDWNSLREPKVTAYFQEA